MKVTNKTTTPISKIDKKHKRRGLRFSIYDENTPLSILMEDKPKLFIRKRRYHKTKYAIIQLHAKSDFGFVARNYVLGQMWMTYRSYAFPVIFPYDNKSNRCKLSANGRRLSISKKAQMDNDCFDNRKAREDYGI